MPFALLPASAAAFAPRSAPNVVLNSKVEPWLTQTLKRVNRVKRPLNSVPQHYRCLTETLAGANAIWTLCSIMLPKAPDADLRKDPNPLVEALYNHQLVHVEAYVVHVDMVSQHEVAFKLTPESIDALVSYHKDIYSVDVAATTWDWSEKEEHLKKLHDNFVQAINRYVFRTGVRALEGMEEEGAGELLEGRSEEVRNALMGLFLPLLPPPPKLVEILQPMPLPSTPSTLAGDNWWQPTTASLPQPQSQPIAVQSWNVLPSTPSPPLGTTGELQQPPVWSTAGLDDFQLPSPTPAFSEPYSETASQFYTSPPPQYFPPVPALPLPSMITSQCGSNLLNPGFGGFSWSYSDFMPQYATTI